MVDKKNRIADALKIRDMKQVDLAERTGISIHTLNPWVNNKWQPKATPLHKMAQALNVSELWLAGYDVPMERPVLQRKTDEVSGLTKTILANDDLYLTITKLMTLNGNDYELVCKLIDTLYTYSEE